MKAVREFRAKIYVNQAAVVKAARKRLGFTQKDISKLLNSSDQFISNVEHGQGGYGGEQIPLLSEILGISQKRLIDAKVADFRNLVEHRVKMGNRNER